MGRKVSYSWYDGSPSLTPGQLHPVICGQTKHDSGTEVMLKASEDYLRTENSIRNMQIMMHPEKCYNPVWQIGVNNAGTENVIRMNRESLRKR